MNGPKVADPATAWWAGHAFDARYVASPHRGLHYLDVLAVAHTCLQPKTYFEIGSQAGNSLALAKVPTVAIDPKFMLPAGFREERPNITTFEMTSDRFFVDHDLKAVLGGVVDFAFLDGMHLFEYLLRDFINTERHASQQSVIALHDCIPPTSAIVSRDGTNSAPPEINVMPNAWAGDVWKMMSILREYRPDLAIQVFDCPPTGLAFVSRLNPDSTVLAENYDVILEKYRSHDITEIGVTEFVSRQSVLESRKLVCSNGADTASVLAPGRLLDH